MRKLSKRESIVMEAIGKKPQTYSELSEITGMEENDLFNIMQSLIVRELIKITPDYRYEKAVK